MYYKKFTKDIGLLGLTQVVTVLGGIFELAIITKFLGAENYGIWAQLTITVSLIAPIVALGLPYTLVRFLAGEKDTKEIQDGFWSVATIIFIFSILISLLLVWFSNNISLLFGCDKIFIILLAFIIIFECLNQLQFDFFRAFQKIKTYSLFTIFRNVLKTGLIILTIFLGYGLFGAVLSMLISRIISFLIMGILIIKRIGIKIPKFLRIKEYLSFGLPPVLGNISFWITQSSDKYLVAFFLGTIFVGYYAPAYTLGCILAFFIAPLSFLLPAVLSKYYEENKIGEVKIHLKYSLKYFLIIAIPSIFGISILSKQLLTIFSTQEIAQQSYYIIPFISLSTMLSGIIVILDQAVNLKKKTYIGGNIWFVSAILNLLLNLLFIPRFGILGAGITTLISYIFAFGAIWYYSFKELPFKIDWKTIIKSIFASLLMSLFIIYLNPIGFYKVITAIILSILIYGILILLLKCFDKKEIEFIKKLNQA